MQGMIDMTDMTNGPNLDLITMTVDITSAYLNHNSVATAELPAVIESIHAALDKARRPDVPEAPALVPAVPVRASIKPDFLICLEDGKKLRMLKRYLRTQFGMTPQEYREKWGLPRDYPMVAPSYATHRATIAKTIGLGRKPATSENIGDKGEAPAPAQSDVPPPSPDTSVAIGGESATMSDAPEPALEPTSSH
jgi:predicted transcriptional regulator